MIIDSTDSLRDLPSDENGTQMVPGFPLEALTGHGPAAMEGRVQADERSEEPGRGSLDAPRAAGMSRGSRRPLPVGTGEGSRTPRHLHLGPEGPGLETPSEDLPVRAVCPVTIDGNTRLEVWVPTPRETREGCELSGEALELLGKLAGVCATANKGEALELPVRLSQGVLKGPVVADWEVGGGRLPVVKLHVHGAVHVRWETCSGRVLVQAKAPYLWSAGAGCTGWRRWAMDWIVGLHRLFFGEDIALEDAHARGWSVTGVELCKDLVGLPGWTHEDTENFLGGSKTTIRGRAGAVETLDVGLRKTSNVSLGLYDKSLELEDNAKDPTHYHRVWKANGWSGEGVQRAELRLRDKALRYLDGTNLRDPLTLCDAQTMDGIWCHQMRRKRLVVPTRKAKRNCPTDPRWVPIMEGSAGLVVVELEQDRSPREDAHRWRTRRNDAQLVDYAARVCALRGITEVPGTVREVLELLELALTRTEVDVINRFHHRRCVYSRTQRMWLGDEIDAARRALGGPARRKYTLRRAA